MPIKQTAIEFSKPWNLSLQFNFRGASRIDFLQLFWLIMLKVPGFVIYDELSGGGEMRYKTAMN